MAYLTKFRSYRLRRKGAAFSPLVPPTMMMDTVIRKACKANPGDPPFHKFRKPIGCRRRTRTPATGRGTCSDLEERYRQQKLQDLSRRNGNGGAGVAWGGADDGTSGDDFVAA